MVATELRKTGISVVGDIPWGTHFCHFYETEKDLLDILIPYLATGLENNEFCMWVVSVPGNVEGARNVLSRAVPEAARHLAAGDIEIVPLSHWSRADETLDVQRVSNDWREKLAQVLAGGYAGMRVVGNAAWLTEDDWKDFLRYEKVLNELIANQRIILSCTYPLATSRADEVFDMARTHQFAVAKRNGVWEMVETPELKGAKAQIRRQNEELERRVVERTREIAAANEELRREIIERTRAEEAQRENQQQYESLVHTIDGIVWEIDDPQGFEFTFVSKQAERLLGYPSEQWLGEPNFWIEHLHPDDRGWVIDYCRQCTARRESHQFECRMIAADGQVVWLRDIVTVNVSDNNSVRLSGVMVDITANKGAEALNRTLLHDLAERVKELTALHEAALFLHQEGSLLPEVLRELAALLLPAFHYPEVAATRICLGQVEAATPQFVESPTGLRADFTTVDGQPGSIEAVYFEDRPPAAGEVGLSLSEKQTFVAMFADLLRTFYDRRWGEAQLKISNEKLRALSASLLSAREAEGTRIAREIHDELGSTLTGLRWELESFDDLISSAPGEKSPPGELREKVAGMLRLTDTTISSVRRIASELRPSVLDDLGLMEAIEWETQRFQTRTGVVCSCVFPPEEISLGQDQTTAVFRILQEALTNILRHARATEIEISLSVETGALVLHISDNGKGITEEEQAGTHSLGLLGMRERAHLVGGSLEIKGVAEKGTTVTIRVPTPGVARN